MSTTRKMLKAENNNLRAMLEAAQHESRKDRATRLHQMEATINVQNQQIDSLRATVEQQKAKIEELEGEIKAIGEKAEA